MKQQKYNIKLTTLTPVCIGMGITLFPYSDYVIDKQKIYYVDQELIKKKLAAKPEFMDRFVNGVAMRMDNNRSKFNLGSFLKNSLGIDVHEQYRFVASCGAVGKKELYTIVKNAGTRPYIPGSSIKGAIKTALLYDWLLNNREGKQRSQLLKGPSNEEANGKIETKLKKFAPELSASSLIAQSKMQCIDTYRLHIKRDDKNVIRQFWESIASDTITRFTLGVKEKPDTDYLEWPALCKRINEYSKASNECEWDSLSAGAKGGARDAIYEETCNSLLDFYENKDEEIANASDSVAYLRLGSGKGYYFNSIGFAIFKADTTKDKKEFRNFLTNFLKACGFGKINKNESSEGYDLDFPLTRGCLKSGLVSSYWPRGRMQFAPTCAWC